MKKLEKITIITGHTKGLGRSVAESAMDYSDKVLGISRTRVDDLNIRQVKKDIGDLAYFPATMFDASEDLNIAINLVLCAGRLGEAGGILNSNPKDWMDTLATNLVGNLSLLKMFIPLMIKSQYGRVVFVAGGGAAYGYPLFEGYALSKVATVRAVENIAIELRDKIKDFSIIALAPGAMETDMLKQVREAGAEVRTVVDIKEPTDFIINFLNMDIRKAKALSGRFIHIRDNLSSRKNKNKWMLRRIE